ncbi:TetR/AcrR family transcriptional regulator [Rhodoplanes sp. TEM]|uniref:TetR/AcrR family transcriptional regulator n=1 Tax=Rhodoplanes tepidamans TaxID=200616 RepID=A0ABT5J7R9_RHOTP|nr:MULTISPECIES: TetR/AcrR family transcriptional regulator [Rhodoplanes]MDC7785702.1 TetR/AcrR family transcriptional regulator [Rhodoplanes tepidamans]MDC7983343.1 TetR/AcrR family transcriptional regulator [Rhodoplanes sp. TEM]MDQ0354730.1 AcrR family transcriptional regulator [Rhodoplanes tepidamans]
MPTPYTEIQPQRPGPRSGGRPSREAAARIGGRILSAARALFLRDGFAKTSMDAIAIELGMSKRTLYARFPAKSDLFAAVAADVLEQSLAGMADLDLPGRPPREQILEAARRFVETALAPELVALDRVATAEARHAPDLARRVHEHAVARSVEVMAGLLSRSGLLPDADPQEIHRDARLLLEFVVLPPLRAAVLGLTEAAEETHSDALLRRRVEIFLDGVVSRQHPAAETRRGSDRTSEPT